MYQYGLIGKWRADRMPDAHPCFDMTKGRNTKKKQEEVVISISTRDLSGTFPILLLGYFVSLAVFVGEKVVKAWKEQMTINK